MSIIASQRTPELVSAIRELAEYRREDPVVTAFNVGNSWFSTNELWRSAPRDTPARIAQHDRESVPGVSQQVFANYGIPSEIELRGRIASRARGDVCDFGAGIGSQLLPLAQRCRCTHVDVGGVQAEYALWRYEGRGYEISVASLPDDDLLGARTLSGRRFDTIICTETLEHVTDPVALVERLAAMVRPGGLAFLTFSFDNLDGMVPMHLNLDRFDNRTFEAEVLRPMGFKLIEADLYRRV